MGSDVQDDDSDVQDDEKPVHEVTLTYSFWMGATPVTQEQFQELMGVNPSCFAGEKKPVEQVNWRVARAYCERLTKQQSVTGTLPAGYEYRLPTEAEWEYAARGGPASKGYTYAGSNTVDAVAWYSDSGSRTHPVGEKRPNELGLYDMSGNVWEWCLDGYDAEYYGRSPNTDPVNTQAASDRVKRGGSWFDDAWYLRSADRRRLGPGDARNFLGFRACLAPTIATD
jgi:formylglycine-generating enzyme required for sulfatase activity